MTSEGQFPSPEPKEIMQHQNVNLEPFAGTQMNAANLVDESRVRKSVKFAEAGDIAEPRRANTVTGNPGNSEMNQQEEEVKLGTNADIIVGMIPYSDLKPLFSDKQW